MHVVNQCSVFRVFVLFFTHSVVARLVICEFSMIFIQDLSVRNVKWPVVLLAIPVNRGKAYQNCHR